MTEDKSFVDLVLERMDTNPEEFIDGTEKFRWATLLHAIRTHVRITEDRDRLVSGSISRAMIEWALDKEEMDAIVAKYREVYRAHLKKDYLRHILAGTETDYRYTSTGGSQILKVSKHLGPQQANPPPSIIAPSSMRDEALQALQTAIDKEEKEAREGNWGSISSSGSFT